MLSITTKPFMLSAIMLNVIMLSVVRLNVVMLSVMAPNRKVEARLKQRNLIIRANENGCN